MQDREWGFLIYAKARWINFVEIVNYNIAGSLNCVPLQDLENQSMIKDKNYLLVYSKYAINFCAEF